MNRSVVAFAVGLIFALGLGLSGMTQPGKVIGFLDVLGNWDPSLLFVMASALAVHMTAYRLIRKRASPLLAAEFEIPINRTIDRKLAVGADLRSWLGSRGLLPGPRDRFGCLALRKTDPLRDHDGDWNARLPQICG